MALWKMFICSQSRRDFYPQFPRSTLGAPGTMNPLLAHTHEKKKKKKEKKKKRNACPFRVLAAKANSTNRKPMIGWSVKACLYNEMWSICNCWTAKSNLFEETTAHLV